MHSLESIPWLNLMNYTNLSWHAYSLPRFLVQSLFIQNLHSMLVSAHFGHWSNESLTQITHNDRSIYGQVLKIQLKSVNDDFHQGNKRTNVPFQKTTDRHWLQCNIRYNSLALLLFPSAAKKRTATLVYVGISILFAICVQTLSFFTWFRATTSFGLVALCTLRFRS